MLGSRLWALQNRNQSSLPYCDPWSECTSTGVVGFRHQTAIIKALMTISLASVGFIDHPITFRE